MARLRDRVAALSTVASTGGVGLAVLVLVTLWLGPLVLVAGLLLLLLRPVRTTLRTTLTRGVVAGLVVAAVVVAGAAVVVPDGWLPVPTGPGVLVSGPAYVGSAAQRRPFPARTATSPAGPVGAGVEVRTAWFGPRGCRDLAAAGPRHLLAICGSRLDDVDPSDLRPRSSTRLPSGSCAARITLDAAGRAVVSGPDRALRTYAVRPRLRRVATLDLRRVLPAGDCVVAALAGAGGRRWFSSREGRVGTVAPGSGRVRVARLGSGERIDTPLSLGAGGAVYVAGDRALHRLTLTGGRLRETWRRTYDRSGGGTASAPTVLPGGLVALVDGAELRPRLLTFDARSGRRRCVVPTFTGDPSEAVLLAAGDVVLVGKGRAHRWLGRGGGSLTRVDVARCRVRWTRRTGLVGHAARISLATGLLDVVTKRPSRLGVDSWYVAGVDARTGVVQFSRRLGTGPWLDPGSGSLVLGAVRGGGTAYVGVRGGIVRVRDQPVG